MANLAGAKSITTLSAEVAEYLFANVAASSTTYPSSTRITQLVNDKYREVCSEKDWWFLFTSASFNTVAGTYNYAIDDLAIPPVMSMTIPAMFLKLKYMPRYMDTNSIPGGQASISNALPLVYIPAAAASNNATTYDLLPTPDAVYSVTYWYKKRVADLASTSVPVIPPEWQDILVHGAVFEAFALLGDKRSEYHKGIFDQRRRQMWLADESNMDWQNTLRSFSQESSVSSYPGLVQPYRD